MVGFVERRKVGGKTGMSRLIDADRLTKDILGLQGRRRGKRKYA